MTRLCSCNEGYARVTCEYSTKLGMHEGFCASRSIPHCYILQTSAEFVLSVLSMKSRIPYFPGILMRPRIKRISDNFATFR